MLQGITFAGFNLADIRELRRKTGKPVIAVFKANSRGRKMESAIRKFHSEDKKRKLEIISRAPEAHSFERIRFQCFGCRESEARQVIKKCLLHSSIPEPIRIAHLIASGTSIGESTPP